MVIRVRGIVRDHRHDVTLTFSRMMEGHSNRANSHFERKVENPKLLELSPLGPLVVGVQKNVIRCRREKIPWTIGDSTMISMK